MEFVQDSLFTLTPGQIAIVLLIGVCLTLFCLLALSRCLRLIRGGGPAAPALRIMIAFIFAWLFEWLSPQVYYTYYLTIFEDIPLQWVIAAPPTPLAVIRLMAVWTADSLSELGRGLIYGLFVLVGLFGGIRSPFSGRRP